MSYTVPVMAIQENSDNKTKTKVERIRPTANKFEYVNLDWWNGFNDKLMTGYIVKAIENNKDLKMASLTIDEFYQNVVAQRSSQLPTINAGFLPGYSDFGNGASDSYAFPILASYELDIYGKNSNIQITEHKEKITFIKREPFQDFTSSVARRSCQLMKLWKCFPVFLRKMETVF